MLINNSVVIHLVPLRGSFVFLFIPLSLLLLLLGSFPALAAIQTDGPVVGGVTDSEAKLFARTDVAAVVEIEYSTASDLSGALVSSSLQTDAAQDYTSIIRLQGLQPDTRYYYRVLVDGVAQQSSPYPTFTSFPVPGTVQDFTFAVMADVDDGRKTLAPTYESIATDSPAFVLQIGDFDHRDPPNLNAMRLMHREVRGTGMIAGATFRDNIGVALPLFHVWDDHDFGADDANKNFPGKADALQAFKEYYPTPDLPNPDHGIWHSFTYGNAEFFMLDTRSNRDPALLPNTRSKSMLDGDVIANGQKAWLLDGLLNSTATWKFIITSVPFNPTVQKLGRDSWQGYPNERWQIVNHIQTNGITGVIAISADLHSGGAIDDGTNADIPEVSVPHTNMLFKKFTTAIKPGEWSEGILPGDASPGYATLRVQTNPDQVIIETRGSDGSIRQTYTAPAL